MEGIGCAVTTPPPRKSHCYDYDDFYILHSYYCHLLAQLFTTLLLLHTAVCSVTAARTVSSNSVLAFFGCALFQRDHSFFFDESTEPARDTQKAAASAVVPAIKARAYTAFLFHLLSSLVLRTAPCSNLHVHSDRSPRNNTSEDRVFPSDNGPHHIKRDRLQKPIQAVLKWCKTNALLSAHLLKKTAS